MPVGPQLYVTFPDTGMPPKLLWGFEKIALSLTIPGKEGDIQPHTQRYTLLEHRIKQLGYSLE